MKPIVGLTGDFRQLYRTADTLVRQKVAEDEYVSWWKYMNRISVEARILLRFCLEYQMIVYEI